MIILAQLVSKVTAGCFADAVASLRLDMRCGHVGAGNI